MNSQYFVKINASVVVLYVFLLYLLQILVRLYEMVKRQ